MDLGKIFFWGFLILGFAALVIGFWFRALEPHRSTLISVGVTLLAASIPSGIMLKQISDLARLNIAALNEDQLVLTLQSIAGRKEIAQVVAQTVLESGFYFTNHTYSAVLRRLEGPLWTDEQKAKFVILHATQTKTVHNPSDRSQEFPIRVKHFNLTSPSVNPNDKQITYEQMTIRVLDHDGREVGTRIIPRDELSRHVAAGGAVSELVPNGSRIPAHGSQEIELTTVSYEPIHNGEIALLAERKTVDMKLSVTFPDNRFDDFTCDPFFVHRGAYETPSTITAQTSRDALKSEITASIKGGILPLNGIIIKWDHK